MNLVRNQYYNLSNPWHLTLVGWGVFFVYAYIYCCLYVTLVAPMPSHLVFALYWTLTEFGVWAAATPILFSTLTRWATPTGLPWQRTFLLSLTTLSIALIYRVGLEQVINPSANVAGSLVLFTPSYITSLVAIVLGWWIFLRPKPLNKTTVNESGAAFNSLHTPSARNGTGHSAPRPQKQTLTVSKGALELELPTQKIACISAAGNYMEVSTETESYLTRATLKQILEPLDTAQFIRTHRSHAVNTRFVDTLVQNQGAYHLLLCTGKSVPVSKTYKPNVVKILSKFKAQ